MRWVKQFNALTKSELDVRELVRVNESLELVSFIQFKMQTTSMDSPNMKPILIDRHDLLKI